MTQASSKNPYRPGVGVRPLYLAGRDAPLRRFGAMLRAAPEQPASMRVTGLRGVGKTVLLEEFADRAQELGWEPGFMELQPSHNTDEAIRAALGSLLDRTRQRLSRLARVRSAAGRAVRATSLSVSWEDVSLSVSFGSLREEDLARDLFGTVELALAKGRTGVVLLLDEAQLIRDERDRHGEHPLSLLIAPVVALQRRELPLALVVCGLPTLTGNLQKARSHSERLFRGEEVDSLAAEQALEAFTRPLEQTRRTANRKLAAAVVEEVEGYPYFIQLWGSELWDGADLADVNRLSVRPARCDAPGHLRPARPRLLPAADGDSDARRAGPPSGVGLVPVPPTAIRRPAPGLRQDPWQRQRVARPTRRRWRALPHPQRGIRVYGAQVPRLPAQTSRRLTQVRGCGASVECDLPQRGPATTNLTPPAYGSNEPS
jgi:AAA ATPase domain